MIDGKEDVARALFSPRMIVDGVLQPETFKLRSSISEDYLSVMRMIFASWMDDIKNEKTAFCTDMQFLMSRKSEI